MNFSSSLSAARSGLAWLCGLFSDSASRLTEYPRTSRRAIRRIKVHFTALLCVGDDRFRVRGLDLHDAGALVLSDKPLDVDSLVFMHLGSPTAKSRGLAGFANVRYCSRRGPSRYAIGLRFCAPLMSPEVGPWQFEHAGSSDEWSTDSAAYSESSSYSMTPALQRDELLKEVHATLHERSRSRAMVA